ncbi:hypothetical protein N7490_005560 [Penicillium lividum]|nr:hypothetical protein N7490_005560 [Penicillium lividum]
MSNPKPRSGLRTIRLTQYIFGIQAVLLLASGVYTLIWPDAAANMPNSHFLGVSSETIQAMSTLRITY